ncbi:MAG: sulfatase-like hydrolase/transferase [Planctomycetota bacterium]
MHQENGAGPSLGPLDPSKILIQCKIVVWTLFMHVVCLGVLFGFAADRVPSAGQPFPDQTPFGWVFFQIGTILWPLSFIGGLLATKFSNIAWRGLLIVTGLVPITLTIDCLIFRVINERFLSLTTIRMIWTQLPKLIDYINTETVAQLLGIVLGLTAVYWFAYWATSRIAFRWSLNRHHVISPLTASVLLLLVTTASGIGGIWRWQETSLAMSIHSTRHPWCVLRLHGYAQVGMQSQRGEAAVLSRLRGLMLSTTVRKRIHQRRLRSVLPVANSDSSTRLNDVLIIVAESIRPELVNPDVMPNLHAMATRGLWNQSHFSGGNASNLGLFSLVNGVEAIWFPKSAIRFSPALNRLYRQAGYEIGFFAGHDDWATFQMDGYVRREVFDVFEIEPMQWLKSDRNAIENTKAFLEQGYERPPRVAVLYLYSTHATFSVDPRFALDRPAFETGYAIPFSPRDRDRVWNRYRNAARTIDAAIAPLLDEKRLVVFVGDHGESFLDDGTIGHGTRLSRFQNMTACVIAGPGIRERKIHQPTMHADVLPTLLSASGWTVPDDALDGIDLNHAAESQLSHRVFATSHYLGHEILLVGPWTTNPDKPFGHRIAFSIHDWQVAALNPIDDQGFALTDSSTKTREHLSHWLQERFNTDPTSQNKTIRQWLSDGLNLPEPDDRVYALNTAEKIASPNASTIRMIQSCLNDRNESVRKRAAEVLVTLQRRIN